MINGLWYWVWPKSIEAFKFVDTLNYLKFFEFLNFLKLSNSSKFQVIELKFCCGTLILSGMVPIEHHTTMHGIDWAQPTGHGPIVHDNNCAPCRLHTLPVDTIVHQPTVHRVDCAWPIGHGSIAHRYNCAPYSLNTVPVGNIEHRSFVHRIDCARAIRHDSVMHRYKWTPERNKWEHAVFRASGHERIQHKVKESTTGWARFNCTRVKLGTGSIEHEQNCAPYRLSTSTTVHHGCYSFAYHSESFSSAFRPILFKNDGATSAGILPTRFRIRLSYQVTAKFVSRYSELLG